MGSALSSLTTSAGLKSPEEAEDPMVSSEDDEGEIRGAKRRKTSTFDKPTPAARFPSESPRRKPFGHVTNESRRAQSRLLGKLQAVQPSAFYGKPRPSALPPDSDLNHQDSGSKTSITTKKGIDRILPEKPINFRKALRIEVFGIEQKPSTGDESYEFPKGSNRQLDLKCRCEVALFYQKNNDLSVPNQKETYRDSQDCILRTTRTDQGGIQRELISFEPFVITHTKIEIYRKRYDPFGQLQETMEFADKYYVQVSLTTPTIQKHWPPFDFISNAMSEDEEEHPVLELLNKGQITKNEILLSCQMPGLLDPNRQSRAADLKLCYGEDVKQKIPYGLRLRMTWSLPSHLSELSTTDVKLDSPRSETKTHINELVAPSPLATKGGEPMESPNKRRRSAVPTYNLKALSAQAQGKSPRTRKSRLNLGSEDTGICVTYDFGKADAVEGGVRQKTIVHGLRCAFCNTDQSSLEDLRLHLHTNHSCFKFSLRSTNPERPKFFVELAKHNFRSSPFDRSRTFQLGKPRTLLDLEKFLNGDETWLKAREGPQHNHWPEHLIDQFNESSLSSSPHDSRHSSPNTSHSTDPEGEFYQLKLPVRTRKVHYVPKTSKPLYDSITKRVLEPGEEIPDSDDEKDEGWLHQKHRDIIMDFSDVTADEKDYIIQWNPYVMEAHLTCERYLPQTVLGFAEANKRWFVERKSRKREFGKHMETFVMRGVLTQEDFTRAIEILRRAEKAAVEEGAKDVDMNEERSISPARQRGTLDCICGEHTQPPDRVICRGIVSSSPTSFRFR